MSHPTSESHSLRGYLTGFVLAVVLTAIPFALVAEGLLSRGGTFAAIAIAAAAQVLVHVRFFLGMTLRGSSRENVLTFAFTAVLIAIMVGGSLWIMFDLDYRHAM